jgi:hypothetical protein
MKRILKYVFSTVLILYMFFPVFPREEPVKEKIRIIGPRIGFDLSRLTLYYFEPERTAYEISFDYEIKRNYYPTVEFGLQDIKLEEPHYNYFSEGYYLKLGMDYNFQKNTAIDQYEMVFFGFRYGFSKQGHSAESIIIADDYWGDFYAESIPVSTFYGHWIELSAGVKAELFKNLFVGWSFRGRLLLFKSKHPSIEPYYIHGFGRGNKRVSLGFTYSIYYRLPLIKSKPKILPVP